MRALVTGANGFLGSELVKLLVGQPNTEVHALVRESSDISAIAKLNVRLIRDDLVRPRRMRESLESVDVIYHLASATSGTHTDLILNTVVGTSNLLEGVKEHAPGKRFVLVSSFSVYGLAQVPSRSLLDERVPVEKHITLRDSYTISKVRQEQLAAKRCSELGIPLIIVRPGKIYHPALDALPPQLGLRIPGLCYLCVGARGLIPLTHVSSCSEAVYLAGITEGIEGEIFNIVDNDLPTQKEFLRHYESRFGRISRRVKVPFQLLRMVAWGAEFAHRLTKGNLPPVLSRYRADNLWKPFRFDNSLAMRRLNWTPMRILPRPTSVALN